MLSTARRVWSDQIRPHFDLSADVDEAGSLEAIERSAQFQGAGVWTLIFAILIASIGLNVNSPAVIIGAMLISPLMGPIVAAGMALGINHFGLLKRALKNLFVATGVGVGASSLYFLLSPLGEAQAELLARTQPTIYDVLVALCGGATGIIALTRREKSLHAVSGVAIATALMPPLCTAGFGLANGYAAYVLGALYLYLINSIFICFSTFVVVRALRFQRYVFVDRATERRVGLYMYAFALLAAIPSLYTAYRTVGDAIFRSRATKYVAETFRFRETKVLEKRFERLPSKDLIEVTLIGKPLDADIIEQLRSRLPLYGLAGTTLTVDQAGSGTLKDIEERVSQSLKSDFLERFYKNNQQLLSDKDERIRTLETELVAYKRTEQLVADLGPELAALEEKIDGVSVGKLPMWTKATGSGQARPTVIVRWKRPGTASERALVDRFVRARLKENDCEVLHQRG
jgi:uncharacterized hydrophobic protein (TIGR00271 family)